MMKLKRLQKSLIKYSLTAVGGIALSVAAAMAVYSWMEGLEAEKQKAERELTSLRRDISSLKEKTEEAEGYMEFFR
ncbi:MAG: hypothetical protein ACPG80_02960, partial [Rickettsiales bacterium]